MTTTRFPNEGPLGPGYSTFLLEVGGNYVGLLFDYAQAGRNAVLYRASALRLADAVRAAFPDRRAHANGDRRKSVGRRMSVRDRRSS